MIDAVAEALRDHAPEAGSPSLEWENMIECAENRCNYLSHSTQQRLQEMHISLLRPSERIWDDWRKQLLHKVRLHRRYEQDICRYEENIQTEQLAAQEWGGNMIGWARIAQYQEEIALLQETVSCYQVYDREKRQKHWANAEAFDAKLDGSDRAFVQYRQMFANHFKLNASFIVRGVNTCNIMGWLTLSPTEIDKTELSPEENDLFVKATKALQLPLSLEPYLLSG